MTPTKVTSQQSENNPEMDADWLYEDQAYFCLTTGVAPSEYDNMTQPQINMFIEVHKKLHKNK